MSAILGVILSAPRLRVFIPENFPREFFPARVRGVPPPAVRPLTQKAGNGGGVAFEYILPGSKSKSTVRGVFLFTGCKVIICASS